MPVSFRNYEGRVNFHCAKFLIAVRTKTHLVDATARTGYSLSRSRPSDPYEVASEYYNVGHLNSGFPMSSHAMTAVRLGVWPVA